MDIYEEFRNIVAALRNAQIDFAVCGGFAMALHGFTRYTKDIDILVPPGDVEKVVGAVKPLGFDFDAGTMQFRVNTPSPQDVRRVSKIVGREYLTLDVLIVGPHLEAIWAERESFEWESSLVPAVSAVGLAKMKLAAGRPQDIVDVQRLGFQIDDPTIQP